MRIDPKIIIFVLLAAFLLSISFTIQKIAALPDLLKADLHVDQQHLHKIDTPINKMMWMAIISGVLGTMTMGLIVYRNKYVVNRNRKRTVVENDLIITPSNQNEPKNKSENDKVALLEKKKLQVIDEINKITRSKKEIKPFANSVISSIAKAFEASQGVFYIATEEGGKNYLELRGGYAYFKPDDGETKALFGVGLAGQVAKAQQPVNIDHIPDGYIDIISGLGQATPSTLIIFPLLSGNKTIGVIEFASFKTFDEAEEKALLEIGQIVAKGAEALLVTKNSTPPSKKESTPKSDKPDS